MKRLIYYISVFKVKVQRFYFRLSLNSYTLKRRVSYYENDKKAPIFIVGCGHSGTSLLLALLDAHPNIYSVPNETKMFMGTMKNLEKWVLRIEKDLIEQKKARWAEKTPSHIHHIAHILQKWPQAKIILILRDPRDTIASLKARFNDLERSITRWIYDNSAGVKYWNHPNVYVIKYEDIISDREKYLAQLFSFLEEEYDPNILDFFQKKRLYYSKQISGEKTGDHNQRRNWQINQPIFDGRGRHSELNSKELGLVERRTKKLSTQLGYNSNA